MTEWHGQGRSTHNRSGSANLIISYYNKLADVVNPRFTCTRNDLAVIK